MAKATSTSDYNFKEEILSFLRQDELDYPAAAAKFGARALPFLNELINGSDEMLATKAAYLAGYISAPATKEILQNAAANKFTTVRIAAAYGANMQDAGTAKAILSKSLKDGDHGVVKVAIRSIGQKGLQKSFTHELKDLQTRALPREIINQAKSISTN